MSEYEVRAVRWEHGWELHIDENRVTQSDTLAGAERMVRDYLTITDVPDAATATVRIVPDVPGVENGEITRARAAVASAAEAQEVAGRLSREIVARLKAAGISAADIARLMGVTRARVYQLAGDRQAASVEVVGAKARQHREGHTPAARPAPLKTSGKRPTTGQRIKIGEVTSKTSADRTASADR